MSPESSGLSEAGDALKNIFGFLEKNLPESDGSPEVPAELPGEQLVQRLSVHRGW